MKRFIVAIIVLFIVTGFSSASEDASGNVTLNIGLSFFYESEASTKGKVAEGILLSSLAVGLGYHFNLIPGIFAPGIYGDMHISLLSLLDSKSNDNDLNNIKEKGETFIGQFGIRLYNQFKFAPIAIQPFFGLNLLVISDSTYSYKVFGILAAVGNFGIEYSYQLPLLRWKNRQINDIHRIAFVYHI